MLAPLDPAAVAVAGALLARRGLRVERGGGASAATLEQRSVLARIVVLNLLVSRALSWPSIVLFARSLVACVPGAMCAFGVLNATPSLALALVLAKVASLAALAAAALVARAQRFAPPATLDRALARTALAACLLAAVDAALDVAFVFVDRPLAEVACCVTLRDLGAPAAAGPLDWRWRRALPLPSMAIYLGTALLALLAFRLAAGPAGAAVRTRRVGLATVAGMAMLFAGLLAAIDALSPVVLHRPHHHCAVEVWTEPLDGPAMLGLLLCGALLPASTLLLCWSGSGGAARAAVSRVAGESLRVASWSSAGVMVMFAAHLVVARFHA
ncbi:MAG: hypothetical protein U1E76_16425 [Planctomycetota bacterium]